MPVKDCQFSFNLKFKLLKSKIKVHNKDLLNFGFFFFCMLQITGFQKNIDDVIVAIKEKMKLYDADKKDRQLRSYEIQVFYFIDLELLIIFNSFELLLIKIQLFLDGR